MRPERNPLDLNNLPDDFSRDGKQVLDDSLSSGGASRKKKERGKVYECRFCSLKFCKSQALGGHMNRHRQERETETLNRARQLVFGSDNLAAPPPHLGCNPVGSAGFGDPYRSAHLPRMLSATSAQPLPHQPFLYTSPSPSSRIPPYSSQTVSNDYYRGHVINNPTVSNGSSDSIYTCIGAPVRNSVGLGVARDKQEGLNWGKTVTVGSQKPLDSVFSFNRFHDGF